MFHFDAKRLVASRDLHLLGSGAQGWFVHLYEWNGRKLQDVASTQGIAPNVEAYACASLKDGRRDQIVALVDAASGQRKIIVFALGRSGLTRVWESPAIDWEVRLGRVQDYLRSGRQHVPLFLDDRSGLYRGKVSLFRWTAEGFTGYEGVLDHPKPAPRMAPQPLEYRVYAEEHSDPNSEQTDDYVTLDGKRVLTIYDTTKGGAAYPRAGRISKVIIELVKQKVDPGKVSTRQRINRVEVTVGDTVIDTLTREDAAKSGELLPSLAQDWVNAIRSALNQLEHGKPPMMKSNS